MPRRSAIHPVAERAPSVSQTQRQQSGSGLSASQASVSKAAPQGSDAISEHITTTVEDIRAQADGMFLKIAENPSYYSTTAQQKDLIRQLSSMLIFIEDAVLKLTISHQNLALRADFRAAFVSMVHSLTRTLEVLKGQELSSCFGPSRPYLGNANIQRIGLRLLSKLKSPFDNIQVDLGMHGAVRIGGTAGVEYQAAANTVREVGQHQEVERSNLATGRVGPDDAQQ